jgi:hypothetical protein
VRNDEEFRDNNVGLALPFFIPKKDRQGKPYPTKSIPTAKKCDNAAPALRNVLTTGEGAHRMTRPQKIGEFHGNDH